MTVRVPADPVRVVALDALRAVREQDAYANLVLPGLLASRKLDGRDAAFATELVYGTLRALGTYDAILGDCVDRPLDKLDPLVLDVLRLGTHQLLATRIGDHAAVDESVKLVREKVGHGPTGLVNAVLRKVAVRDLAGWCAAVAPRFDVDPIGNLALTYSHPRWIVEAFRDALDGDLDETTALLIADNVRPAVTLVARPGRSDVEELVSLGARPGRWAPTAAILDGGAPANLAPVREGRAGVQDEGSQLVALALAAAPIEGRDLRWLDMCAGPGGKAALLAGLANARGARLLAVERQPHRARLVARGWQHCRCRGRRRHNATVGAGLVRSGPGRRPVFRSWCAAAQARSPLATHARRYRGSASAASGSAALGNRGRAARGARRVCHVLASSGRDQGAG